MVQAEEIAYWEAWSPRGSRSCLRDSRKTSEGGAESKGKYQR